MKFEEALVQIKEDTGQRMSTGNRNIELYFCSFNNYLMTKISYADMDIPYVISVFDFYKDWIVE